MLPLPIKIPPCERTCVFPVSDARACCGVAITTLPVPETETCLVSSPTPTTTLANPLTDAFQPITVFPISV